MQYQTRHPAVALPCGRAMSPIIELVGSSFSGLWRDEAGEELELALFLGPHDHRHGIFRRLSDRARIVRSVDGLERISFVFSAKYVISLRVPLGV